MNRFRETMDELRKRSNVKDLKQLLPPMQDEDAFAASADPEFGLPYSSEPPPIVEPWK